MTLTSKTRVLLALIIPISLAIFGVAHAQDDRGPQGSRDSVQQNWEQPNPNEDAVSAQDHVAWTRDNIEGRTGIHFRSHTTVCGDTGGIHCNARVITDVKGAPSASALPAGVGPAQLHAAYSSATSTASRRVIGIVDAYDDPNITSDLAFYSSTYGIAPLPSCATGTTATSSPTPCFQKVNQNGGTTYPKTDAGWALEIALDVETAHAVCQNCSIVLVEASSSSYADLMTAVDRAVTLGSTAVSNSYGSSEFSGETAYDSHFNKTGVAFVVAAGDAGYGAEYPAASRYVTAVGGTTLLMNTNGTYNRETAWSGTGSGCSAYETKQSWQPTVSGCTKRVISDIAAVADPNTGAAVYDTVKYGNKTGWFQVGGTSLATPVIAALYALSGNVSGNANQIPYTLGNTSTNLRDVVSGSNGRCSGSLLCTAITGYDGPTGLGTPNGLSAL